MMNRERISLKIMSKYLDCRRSVQDNLPATENADILATTSHIVRPRFVWARDVIAVDRSD